MTEAVGGRTIDDVLTPDDGDLAAMPHELAARRAFLATYQRTTQAVADAIEAAAFEDPAWVEAWDVVFADLYLDALEADLAGDPRHVPRPWRLAFDAPPTCHRCGTCCSASTPTSTTTCRRPCSP